LIDACKNSNAISVEAWVKPANTTQSGPARIVTLSKDTSNRNFTMGQSCDFYDLRLRTTATGRNGKPSLAAPQGFLSSEPTHVVYTFDSKGEAILYINGMEVSRQIVGGDLFNWDESYGLALANEHTMDRPWLGEMYLVAFYDRALNPEEINQSFQAGMN
jgi:hypothetical protein